MVRYLEVIVICLVTVLQLNGFDASPDASTVGDVAMPCIYHHSGSDLHVDCTRSNLTSVPHLPPTSTSVDLSDNQITEILPSAFSGLSLLKELNISYNPLEYVANDAFKDLKNLTILRMRRCALLKQEDLSLDSLLNDLVSLREFSLTFNSSLYYPDNGTCLQYMKLYQRTNTLSTVDVLEIDSVLFEAFQQTKTKSTRYMAKELKLYNGVFCIFVQLSKENFDFMPDLVKLSIFKDNALGVDYLEDAFSLLVNLTELTFDNDLNVFCYSSFESLHYFFRNISISVSYLPRLKTLKFFEMCLFGTYDLECHVDLSPLENASSLDTFVSARNPFTFSDTLLCKLPKSFRHFEFPSNCLMFTGLDWLFNGNPHIETFKAPNQNHVSCKPQPRRNEDNTSTSLSSTNHDEQTKGRYVKESTINLTTLIYTHSFHPLAFQEGMEYNHLKYLDLSWNQYNIQNVLNIPAFFSLGRPNLEYLDLTGCQVVSVEKDAFLNFTKLKFLYMSHNVLGNMDCELYDRLKHLEALTELSLDSNKIECVLADFLTHLKHLRLITMRYNLMSSFNVDLSRLTYLEELDLSYNRITHLPDVVRGALDQLAETGNVTVDLTGNILQCNCDTLNFLKWLTETKVHVRNMTEYRCQFRNGSQANLRLINQVISTYSIECASKTVLIVTASVAGTFFIVMIVTAVLYRNRWKVRYLYYMAKLQVASRNSDYERIFEYDAFVSYTSDDSDIARSQAVERLEVQRELRLCIHERDFPPGHSIPMNICRCIHNSKRTLFFISRAFLDSRWCECELRFAVEESLTTGRNVILLVMLENIPGHELPVSVLDLIRKYTYLEYPRGRAEEEINVFWARINEFVCGV